jgi:hypothetical protein
MIKRVLNLTIQEINKLKYKMKLNDSLKYFATAAVAGLFFLSSCSKSDEQNADTTNGEKASESENVIQDAVGTANDGLDGSVDGISNGRTESCATVSNDATAKILTIDFGTAGCVGIDGRTRKGKIAILYVGTVPQTSTSRTITFTNYSVNSYSISGSITQSNFQRPSTGNYSFSLSATNVVIILSDGKTYSISQLQRTFSTNSGALQDLTDDVTTITGTSTQTSSTGNVTTVNITSPITIKGSCTSTGFYYPTSGTYEVIDGKVTYTIDWGTGTCDKSISITAFGKTTVKSLP